VRLFLGVDGGQSGTMAVIGDEAGRVLGTGEGGPCNHAAAAEGRAKLERAITESLRAACTEAQLDFDSIEFEAACFGMSGGPDDKEDILKRLVRARCQIVTIDGEIALAGATTNGCGIIVIAGTGSIAFGRNASGYKARAGGWGYIFGDEGGAFDVVRQSLRAALRMEEGWGPPTALRQVLLEATGSRNANETLHWFYGSEWPRHRVATLAPLIDRCAREGDQAALAVLNRAAQELASLAGAVRAQLWKPRDEVEVAYIGGVFESDIIRERFRLLIELEDGNRCGPPLRGPAEGALLEAIRSVR
jgi:N-acetylglucosamine kinase-like BadF-type ATPase